MAGKKDIDMKDMDLGDDGLPSEEDLDALQRAIDMEIDGMAQREAATEGSEAEDDSDAQKIEQLEAELANLKDKALRAMADADNVKKRAEREVAAAKIYGIERFATDVLSVVDNLGRALMTLEGHAKESLGDNAKNLLEGIELTEKNLMAVLARHGIKAVPGKGFKFDPNVHQAVAQIPSDEEKGNVAEVMQVGFTIGERTLRAAMVAVSTGKS